MGNHPEIKNIAVASHPRVHLAGKIGEEIRNYLESLGVGAIHGSLYDESLRKQVKEEAFDVLIALGGDGTMLRAGHLCAPVGIPILGVNLGKFGFLIEIRENNWKDAIEHLLSGNYWIEKRMMLCGEHWRSGDKLGTWDVLNEVVVSRGQIIRPVHLTATVDGQHLTTYVADALIAATATGSTAYAMAAGGPILPPQLRNILLVAVAPHLSIDRAVVLSEGSSVSITVHTDHQAVLSIDGQVPIGMDDGDRVDVRASSNTVKFIRIQDPGYFYRNLTPHMYQNPSTENNQ